MNYDAIMDNEALEDKTGVTSRIKKNFRKLGRGFVTCSCSCYMVSISNSCANGHNNYIEMSLDNKVM